LHLSEAVELSALTNVVDVGLPQVTQVGVAFSFYTRRREHLAIALPGCTGCVVKVLLLSILVVSTFAWCTSSPCGLMPVMARFLRPRQALLPAVPSLGWLSHALWQWRILKGTLQRGRRCHPWDSDANTVYSECLVSRPQALKGISTTRIPGGV
jgi:hypothetical protein